MAEENSLSNTEIQIRDAKDKVSDLNDRISQRSNDLKVNDYIMSDKMMSKNIYFQYCLK